MGEEVAQSHWVQSHLHVHCELWLGGVELQAVGSRDEAFAVVAGDGLDVFIADGCSSGVRGCSLQIVVAAGCAICRATRHLFDESEMWTIPRCFRLIGTADRMPLGALR